MLFYVSLCGSMYFFVLFYLFLCCSMYFCVVTCIFCVVIRIFVLFYVFFALFYLFLRCSMYFCVVLCIVCFVTFPVLFVCTCVLNNCHRVATQLQFNISYHIFIIIIIIIIIWHYNPLWVFAFSAKPPSSSILSCLLPVFDFQLF